MARLGVGIRLSLALLALILAALGIVYALLVPPLEDRLVNERRGELRRTLDVFARGFGPTTDAGLFVRTAAETANARAVILQEFGPDTPGVYADSGGTAPVLEFARDPVAQRALATGEVVSGTVTRGGRRYVEVAAPLVADSQLILLLSSSVSESLETVDVVEERLLTAGLLAVIVAVALGFGAATLHARRIRRLQRAADHMAHGYFDEAIEDRGSDELGELARAFERMRGRLATLDHARREFVANASHELRTPIFALGAALELLQEEDLDDETRREFLTTAREQVERVTRLAADLLDLTRLDAERIEFDVGTVELGVTADVLADEFEAAGDASGHAISVERDGLALAAADADRVLRIGRALVENAIVHTPAGTRVRLRALRDDGRAVLEVEDDGPGIPEEHVERIFDRFYRVEGGRASGSGLGLAIARELAERMGGALEATSDSGATRFRLVLPVSETPDST